MIEFEWLWVAALFPLPLLALLLPRATKQEAALHVPFFSLAAGYQVTGSGVQRRGLFRKLLALTCWSLLVIAAMRPQWIGEPIELPTTGRDLMLAVDISGSMGTEDMVLRNQGVTRLQVVKEVVGDFVERRVGDRIGLILFGSQAYLQTPLTFDRATVRSLLDETPLGIAGGKTAIGDAIGLSVKRLIDRPAESRILILLTDGQNNIGEVTPIQAAQIAGQQGVKIYTVGFGADELVVPGLLFNRTINPSSELDAKSLSEIAQLTGGIYQRARNAQELGAIYEALDQLEPIEQDQETYRPVKSLYYWPLGIALCLTLLLACLQPQLLIWLTQLMRRQSKSSETEAAIR